MLSAPFSLSILRQGTPKVVIQGPLIAFLFLSSLGKSANSHPSSLPSRLTNRNIHAKSSIRASWATGLTICRSLPRLRGFYLCPSIPYAFPLRGFGGALNARHTESHEAAPRKDTFITTITGTPNCRIQYFKKPRSPTVLSQTSIFCKSPQNSTLSNGCSNSTANALSRRPFAPPSS